MSDDGLRNWCWASGAALEPCPKWGDLGHNWLQGGYAWWRDWAHLRPWRKWHVCTGCQEEQYEDGTVRRPARIDGRDDG